ncbi:NADP-dependent phosphogluconate dehydrogenase [Candidatus Peregrinibacteria bacterium]|nr:NADP-dependent phosphogluconate dehydrogenase [Candidatus Peregrinibacteria bacterium]
MGANLARNAARNGAQVVLFNRTTKKTAEFIERYGTEGNLIPAMTLKEFMKALKPPRIVLLMVKAGNAVDSIVTELLQSANCKLQPRDTLIDAGNSHYRDTERRGLCLERKGIRFIGMGVSGGEYGALMGPSMMPGGDKNAVMKIMPFLKKMTAGDGSGGRCVTYIGPGGAGHFVKMVHNGIEYGIMQLIAECYDLLKSIGKMKNKNIAQLFAQWSRSAELGSFLTEITAKIFTVRDSETGNDMIDVIGDAAGQKGTGKWMTEAAMNLGIAIPTINASVDARMLSGETERRGRLRRELPAALIASDAVSANTFAASVRSALELSVICTYAQGFELMEKASSVEGWNLHLGEVARIWRGGCIIRSAFLEKLQRAYGKNTATAAAASKEIFSRFAGSRQKQWRRLIGLATDRGVPTPALSASLWFYDSLRRERLPQNLIQAQRDYFGSHGFHRTDRPGTFHADWNS